MFLKICSLQPQMYYLFFNMDKSFFIIAKITYTIHLFVSKLYDKYNVYRCFNYYNSQTIAELRAPTLDRVIWSLTIDVDEQLKFGAMFGVLGVYILCIQFLPLKAIRRQQLEGIFLDFTEIP